MATTKNSTLAALKSLRAQIREELKFLAQDKRETKRHSPDWHSADGGQFALRFVLEKLKALEASAKVEESTHGNV